MKPKKRKGIMNGKQLARWHIGLVVLWIIIIATLFGMSALIQYRLETSNTTQTEAPTEIKPDETYDVYNTGILEEKNMFCPYCGVAVIAVNEEVVCRNEMCEVYGLPVRVIKYGGYMNIDADNSSNEQ